MMLDAVSGEGGFGQPKGSGLDVTAALSKISLSAAAGSVVDGSSSSLRRKRTSPGCGVQDDKGESSGAGETCDEQAPSIASLLRTTDVSSHKMRNEVAAAVAASDASPSRIGTSTLQPAASTSTAASDALDTTTAAATTAGTRTAAQTSCPPDPGAITASAVLTSTSLPQAPPPPVCLHCSKPASSAGMQVSCDDCHSFICNACHWCHEFQANHEIRVCDRCEAFYCRACDEMDQCEDCSEVVCASCTSLMSCKFCGCGLCEDCATACGRCGIVLCSKDVKFAVDCDTCKLPYCLVCLASATKETCVRCGLRQSKRVEQLVHLRLKSIYKAFQQSTHAKQQQQQQQQPSLNASYQGDMDSKTKPIQFHHSSNQITSSATKTNKKQSKKQTLRCASSQSHFSSSDSPSTARVGVTNPSTAFSDATDGSTARPTSVDEASDALTPKEDAKLVNLRRMGDTLARAFSTSAMDAGKGDASTTTDHRMHSRTDVGEILQAAAAAAAGGSGASSYIGAGFGAGAGAGAGASATGSSSGRKRPAAAYSTSCGSRNVSESAAALNLLASGTKDGHGFTCGTNNDVFERASLFDNNIKSNKVSSNPQANAEQRLPDTQEGGSSGALDPPVGDKWRNFLDCAAASSNFADESLQHLKKNNRKLNKMGSSGLPAAVPGETSDPNSNNTANKCTSPVSGVSGVVSGGRYKDAHHQMMMSVTAAAAAAANHHMSDFNKSCRGGPTPVSTDSLATTAHGFGCLPTGTKNASVSATCPILPSMDDSNMRGQGVVPPFSPIVNDPANQAESQKVIGGGGSGSGSGSGSDFRYSRTEAEADAAAAELLRELDLEEAALRAKKLLVGQGSQGKGGANGKNKKKKKNRNKNITSGMQTQTQTQTQAPTQTQTPTPTPTQSQTQMQMQTQTQNAQTQNADVNLVNASAAKMSTIGNTNGVAGNDSVSSLSANLKKKSSEERKAPRGNVGKNQTKEVASSSDKPSPPPSQSTKEDNKVSKSVLTSSKKTTEEANADDGNSLCDMEETLSSFIEAQDKEAIEAFLASIKGVPGRAALRKNAKKALKRLKEAESSEPANGATKEFSGNSILVSVAGGVNDGKLSGECLKSTIASGEREFQTVGSLVGSGGSAGKCAASDSNKREAPLKLIKYHTTAASATQYARHHAQYASHQNHSSHHNAGATRTECIYHMSPAVVGWVIGRGGQRIRDIMEESSAKVWIDQDSMGPTQPRVVYISGAKKSVDSAMKIVKDLVEKAPALGGSSTSLESETEKPAAVLPTATPKSTSTRKPSSTPILPASVSTAWAIAKQKQKRQEENVHSMVRDHMAVQKNEKSDISVCATTMSHLPAVSTAPLTKDASCIAPVYTEVMKCEPRFVALLIGRRGWTVKHIQDASNARVEIDQSVTPRRIAISGETEECVKLAAGMVRDVLSYPHAQLHYNETDGDTSSRDHSKENFDESKFETHEEAILEAGGRRTGVACGGNLPAAGGVCSAPRKVIANAKEIMCVGTIAPAERMDGTSTLVNFNPALESTATSHEVNFHSAQHRSTILPQPIGRDVSIVSSTELPTSPELSFSNQVTNSSATNRMEHKNRSMNHSLQASMPDSPDNAAEKNGVRTSLPSFLSRETQAIGGHELLPHLGTEKSRYLSGMQHFSSLFDESIGPTTDVQLQGSSCIPFSQAQPSFEVEKRPLGQGNGGCPMPESYGMKGDTWATGTRLQNNPGFSSTSSTDANAVMGVGVAGNLSSHLGILPSLQDSQFFQEDTRRSPAEPVFHPSSASFLSEHDAYRVHRSSPTSGCQTAFSPVVSTEEYNGRCRLEVSKMNSLMGNGHPGGNWVPSASVETSELQMAEDFDGRGKTQNFCIAGTSLHDTSGMRTKGQEGAFGAKPGFFREMTSASLDPSPRNYFSSVGSKSLHLPSHGHYQDNAGGNKFDRTGILSTGQPYGDGFSQLVTSSHPSEEINGIPVPGLTPLSSSTDVSSGNMIWSNSVCDEGWPGR